MGGGTGGPNAAVQPARLVGQEPAALLVLATDEAEGVFAPVRQRRFPGLGVACSCCFSVLGDALPEGIAFEFEPAVSMRLQHRRLA